MNVYPNSKVFIKLSLSTSDINSVFKYMLYLFANPNLN